jgi:hypothetical protein
VIPFPLAAEFRIFARRPEDPIVEFCCRIFTRVRNGGNESDEVNLNVVLTAYRG